MDRTLQNMLRYYFFGLLVAAVTFAISPPKHPWITVAMYVFFWGLFELVWLIARLYRKRKDKRIQNNFTVYIRAWVADNPNGGLFEHIDSLTEEQSRAIAEGKQKYPLPEGEVAPQS